MKFVQLIAKYAMLAWNGIKKFGRFLYSKRTGIAEAAKSIGAVATSITSTIMASKAVTSLLNLLRNKKGKKADATNPKGARMGADGKVRSNKSKSKGKRRTQSVEDEFADDLKENSRFYDSCTSEEKDDLKKIERAEARQVKTPEQINSTMFGTYHVWNRAKSLAWNEMMEAQAYYEAIGKFYTDPQRVDAARQALTAFQEAYTKVYPDPNTDHNNTRLPRSVEEAKQEAENFAFYAEQLRQKFDSLTDEIYHGGYEEEPLYEEEPVNPIVGDLEAFEDEELPLEESPEDPVVDLNIQHAGGRIVNGKRLPEMYLIGNLALASKLPSYYTKDPDPDKRKLGNVIDPNFVSVITWKPGVPHDPACPEEIAHHYDWSEFEGLRQHPEIASMEDAFQSKGFSWCNENLECARVFNDLYLQHPCIYPGNPGYEDFEIRFRNAYWDLCRVVPGLGDCGRVLAPPFAGREDDPEASIAALREYGDYNLIYGLNNPPSMEKVFYEIMRYGTLCFLEKITELEQAHPEVKFNIVSPVQVADLYYQGALLLMEQGKLDLPDELVESILVELEAYGVHLDYVGGGSHHETVPAYQQANEGFACSPDELDD